MHTRYFLHGDRAVVLNVDCGVAYRRRDFFRLGERGADLLSSLDRVFQPRVDAEGLRDGESRLHSDKRIIALKSDGFRDVR